MSDLVVLAPMRIEAAAARRGAQRARVVRSGVGPNRSLRTAARMAADPACAVAVAGFAGALRPGLQPGDVVVAEDVRDAAGATVVSLPGASFAAGLLRRGGLRALAGPIVSVPRPALGARARRRLSDTGALAVDMESAWLVGEVSAGRSTVVVRVILDTPEREVWRPLATLTGVRHAGRALRHAVTVLETDWAPTVAR